MADQTTDTKAAPDYLSMSDEEFLKAPLPADTPAPTQEETQKEEPENTTTEEEVEQEGTPEEPDEQEETEQTSEEDKDAGSKEAEAGARQGTKAKADAADKSEAKTKEEDPNKSTEPKGKAAGGSGPADTATTNEPVDYEKAYRELMAPFKANGREIQVKSVEDVKQLMQMGANYNKKMQAMKPGLRVLKMLENNGLLDENKLAFLIDLDKKNPEAISKLVKESGVDPLEIDEEKAKGYKSGTYSVDDKEIELDTVLGELESTPTFNKLLSVVGKEWDQSSRNTIAQHPQLLRLINTHVERGIYDLISKEVESERAMGRLVGLSDFDAYRQVGDAMNARGGFDHLSSTEEQGQRKPPVQTSAAPNPKKVDEDKLKDKRRAASNPRSGSTSAVTTNDYNPLAMSDEEFEKMAKKAGHLM